MNDIRNNEFFTVGGLFTTPRSEHGFRIDSFLKAVQEPRWDVNDPEQVMIAEIMGEENDIVTRWFYCNPAEATHVSGSGVCGTVVKVEEITLTGHVKSVWSAKLMAQETASFTRRIGTSAWSLNGILKA
jgi:hypothetical protein